MHVFIQAWSALYWNQQGMPKSKIMVGIPTYGHTYKLVDPAVHCVDAPASSMGENGGDISFPEVLLVIILMVLCYFILLREKKLTCKIRPVPAKF